MEKTIDIHGVRVRYDVAGSGDTPVIVLHGWGCTAQTVKVLSDACSDSTTTVYTLDLPGFGGSQEPAEVWGIEDYTAMLDDFTKALGIKRPVLVGHSFGGRMSIVFASRNDTDRVILVDAAGVKPHRTLKYYAKVYSFKTAKFLAPLLMGKRRADALIERMRGRSGSSDYASATPKMRAIMSRVVNEDLCHLMPKIKAPTLLIWGENDTATPLSDAKKMERLIPDAGLVSYPGAGHYSFLERQAQTAAVIASFLNLKR